MIRATVAWVNHMVGTISLTSEAIEAKNKWLRMNYPISVEKGRIRLSGLYSPLVKFMQANRSAEKPKYLQPVVLKQVKAGRIKLK